jgi:hypothetical protein
MKEKAFDNDLDPRIKFGMSESGYSNDELGFEWIQHFHKYTKDSVRGEWRLLIMDGHGSHMTKDFIDFCYEYKIHPFLLPAHSTHLLQPLDVGCFQPMKHHHQQLLEENIWYGGIDFDRSDFLACFQQISDRTFKAGTIRHAWQKTGLSPFWPRAVLDKLVEYNPPEERRPTTPNNDGFDFSNCETPNSGQLEIFQKFIDIRINSSILNGIPPTPSVARAIEKRDKATRMRLLDRQVIQEELVKRREQEKEKARRKSGHKVVQKFGTIEVGDARLRIIKRNEKKAEAREESNRKYLERRTKVFVLDIVKQVRISARQKGHWPRAEAVELTVLWTDHVTRCAPYLFELKARFVALGSV